MSVPTLLDIAKQNGVDAVVGLIDEATKVVPEVSLGAARTIKGLNYRTLVRTSLGNASGSFRNANEGSTPHVHVYENRLVETYILNPRWHADKAVADRHEDGYLAYVQREAEGTMEGEMQGLAKQFYYGTAASTLFASGSVIGSAKGFPGLLQMYDATNCVVDAGGTTDDTCSSVWLVRFGPKNVQWVWGNSGQLEPSDLRIESIADANTSGAFIDMYVQTFLGYPGLQVGSLNDVVRIKKLTADSGKGLTDDVLATALGKFKPGQGPNACFMTLRSLAQLQASRTATNPTGAPAPFPTSIKGIDGSDIAISVTEGILNTEKIAS